jgi:hypothetical protein
MDRFVPDPDSESGTRSDGAARLFHRSGGTWNDAGFLGPIGTLTEWVKTGLAMAEQPLNVTTGTWYTLRLEKVGGKVRVYVNDTLRISHDEPAPYGGQVGLITYKAAADFDDFHAYMP